MKSLPQDQSIKTSCKNCIFAAYDNKTQTGCIANRLEKFDDLIIEAYDEEKEFYVVKSFCNYYRNNTWNNGIADINLVKNESSIDVTLLFDCDNISENDSSNIIDYIKSLNYIKSKLKIMLFSRYNINSVNIKNIVDIYKWLSTNSYNVVITKYINRSTYLHETIAAEKTMCHAVISKDNIPKVNFIRDLNNKVNDDLLKFLIANNANNNIISNIAYRINYLNNYDECAYDYDKCIELLIKEAKRLQLYIEI